MLRLRIVQVNIKVDLICQFMLPERPLRTGLDLSSWNKIFRSQTTEIVHALNCPACSEFERRHYVNTEL